eukprot:6897465-Prymnesium_polylepis.2
MLPQMRESVLLQSPPLPSPSSSGRPVLRSIRGSTLEITARVGMLAGANAATRAPIATSILNRTRFERPTRWSPPRAPARPSSGCLA